MERIFDKLLVGADPELFLQNPNSGAFVSAHNYVKGTKEQPFPVDKGAVQLDGTAAEFNIYPAKTANEFVGNIRTVMARLAEMTHGSGYQLVAEPVADFDPVYFDTSIPTSAKILGCDPDYDAWELRPNDPPDQTRTFRTGAGHIHLGWGKDFDPMSPDHFQLCAEVCRQLDYYVGIWSLLWDKDNRRRELYGRAGAFRPKTYGVEYRVLSNSWLKSEMLQRWVYKAATTALHDLDDGLRYEDFHKDLAQEIINGNDLNWFGQPGAPEFDNIPLPPGIKTKAA